MLFQPYGLILAFSVLLGAYVAATFARQRGQDGQIVWDALLWVLPFGLIGARLYHVLSLWNFYSQNPRQVFYLWNGGLGIYGALGGGLLGLLVFARVGGTPLRRGFGGVFATLDVAAPGVAIAQSVGRFANYFNHELYGWPTSLPWGIFVPPAKRFPGLLDFAYFHPLFWYESLFNLLNFAFLLVASRKFSARLRSGDLFLLYLSVYSLGRFFLEPLRIESWSFQGLRIAQLVSLTIFLLSVLGVVGRRIPFKNLQLNLFSR